MNTRGRVERVYQLLLREYGKQHWWPAETPFEVCVGAILTQATSWVNVEKAIYNLKSQGLLDPIKIKAARMDRLARLIKPSLYYNVKARKLKEFASFLTGEYGGQVENMKAASTENLRRELLGVWGLGPETVDSILLYALGKPSFVVDAYTRRVFSRLGLVEDGLSYMQVRGFFEAELPKDAALYNEYHALIVEHGKGTCRKKPLCTGCCLRRTCKYKPS
jgi:endonuclease-3 related protein